MRVNGAQQTGQSSRPPVVVVAMSRLAGRSSPPLRRTPSPPCWRGADQRHGPAYAARIGRRPPARPVRRKPSDSAWFVGYTPQLSSAVELLDPRGQSGNPLTNITINGQTYQHVFGGDVPALIWGRSMYNAIVNDPITELRTAATESGQ